MRALKLADAMLFLSTLSLRRATGNIINSNCNLTHFYPRSPCGERHTHPVGVLVGVVFLSTLSLRRATRQKNINGRADNIISIHALLAESDLGGMSDKLMGSVFLSTLSLRRATQKLRQVRHMQNISIHALLAESDAS